VLSLARGRAIGDVRAVIRPHGQREDEPARLFRPRSGLHIQGMMPGANTNGQTNRTRWLSHADKSIAEESGRRAVSQADRAAEAFGPCPAEERVSATSNPSAPRRCGAEMLLR